MVYEYRIEYIGLHYGSEGFSIIEDYELLIAEYASKGWRFVQLVNFSELSSSERRIDLIFEKEKRKGSDKE